MNILTRAMSIICVTAAFFSHVGAASPDHGLFFDNSEVPRFRHLFATHPVFADLRHQMDTIDRVRERTFLRTGVNYNDQLYDIARVGTLAQQMALLYLYTGDRDAASLAEECVETLMKFPKWDYFLEDGKDIIGLQQAPNSALAVALAVEALGDRLPKSTVDRWLQTMAARGTEPCFRSTYGMRYPERVKGWTMDTTSTFFIHRPLERSISLARWPIILNTINLKAIPASALALSALVYQKHVGENADTRRWLEQALFSVRTFQDIYAKDGSYNEGVSYAHYTTLHLIRAIDALKRGGVADLTDLLNWDGYQKYLLEMTLPAREDPHAIVNFSDAGTGAHASVSFWISRHTRDGLARWFGEHLALSRDIWSVLYYDTTVQASPPVQGTHVWHSNLDWIVGRTGYGVDDLVVAMRSGPPFNHEHADRNSLIVKCFGERLIVDPMRPPYSYRDPAWKMRLTTGHSAVLIDGLGHQYVDGHEGTNASRAAATIIRSGEREGCFFWTSDATSAYQLLQPDVAAITRTVITLTRIPVVVLVDKVIKQTTPSTIQARFYTYNSDAKGSIDAGESGFTVTRPSARLFGCAATAGGVLCRTAFPDIPLEQSRLYPYVDVSTTQPQKEICLVTVLLPTANGVAGNVTVQRDSTTYTIAVPTNGRIVNVRIWDTGVVPEFEVR
jgi:Heparinase II/III-like protein